jgi:hypothetical protein
MADGLAESIIAIGVLLWTLLGSCWQKAPGSHGFTPPQIEKFGLERIDEAGRVKHVIDLAIS